MDYYATVGQVKRAAYWIVIRCRHIIRLPVRGDLSTIALLKNVPVQNVPCIIHPIRRVETMRFVQIPRPVHKVLPSSPAHLN